MPLPCFHCEPHLLQFRTMASQRLTSSSVKPVETAGLAKGPGAPWLSSQSVRPATIANAAAAPPIIQTLPSSATATGKEDCNTGCLPSVTLNSNSSCLSFKDRFDIQDTIGQGSHGVVKAAIDKLNQQHVAIKVLVHYKGRSSQKRALAHEVAIWNKMQAASEHVVRLHGVHQDEQHTYLVQELCVGGSLQDLLDSRLHTNSAFAEEELAQVSFSILEFLSAIHAEGILYGDLKPGNLVVRDLYPCIAHLINPNKHPSKGCLVLKAVDFGCARQLTPGEVVTDLTGTAFFSAPEVIKRQYGLPADLWALGVMLYEMVTGTLPFWQEPLSGLAMLSDDAISEGILHNTIRYDSNAWQQVSAEMRDLVQKLLERDPSKRITAAEALQHPWIQAWEGQCYLAPN